MFEDLERRGGAAAARRARAVAEAVAAQVPAGVAAEVVAEGVLLSGRGLRARLATEASLRLLGRVR